MHFELVLSTAYRTAVGQVEDCFVAARSKARKTNLDQSHYLAIQQLQSRAGSEQDFHTHMDLLVEEEVRTRAAVLREAEEGNSVLLQYHQKSLTVQTVEAVVAVPSVTEVGIDIVKFEEIDAG